MMPLLPRRRANDFISKCLLFVLHPFTQEALCFRPIPIFGLQLGPPGFHSWSELPQGLLGTKPRTMFLGRPVVGCLVSTRVRMSFYTCQNEPDYERKRSKAHLKLMPWFTGTKAFYIFQNSEKGTASMSRNNFITNWQCSYYMGMWVFYFGWTSNTQRTKDRWSYSFPMIQQWIPQADIYALYCRSSSEFWSWEIESIHQSFTECWRKHPSYFCDFSGSGNIIS